MKKILFIAPIDTKDRFKGGITSYAETIIKNKELFNNSEIDFVPLNNCIVNRKSGTNGKFSARNIINFFKTRHLISKQLKENRYDAIYLNTSYGISLLKDLLTLKKKYAKKCQVFLHIHFAGFDNIFTKKKIIRKAIKRNLKAKATNIISLSTKFKDELVSNGFDKNTIDILYNYFDPNLYNIGKDKLQLKLENHKEITTFLFVGSLDKRKGFYDLVEVFRKLDDNKTKLIICGKPNDNESQKTLDSIAGEPGFEYRGFVSGELKNKAFLDSDVLILPSYGEGLPITILEAFHFGLPVISTDVGAIPEIINQDNGFIIHPGDVDDLRKKIEKFYDKALLARMSEYCLKDSENYTFKTFANKLIKIVNQ